MMETAGNDGLQVVHDNVPLECINAGLPTGYFGCADLKAEAGTSNLKGTLSRTKYFRGRRLWIIVGGLVSLAILILVIALFVAGHHSEARG